MIPNDSEDACAREFWISVSLVASEVSMFVAVAWQHWWKTDWDIG